MPDNILLTLLFYLVSLAVLYAVIETAVRKGINNSTISQLLEKKYGLQEKEEEKSFLNSDLNNDK